MTTSMRWWQYIGPWPLRPWVVFWGIGAVSLISTSSARRGSIIESPAEALLGVFLPALTGTVAFSLVVMLIRNVLTAGTPHHLVSYLLLVGLGAAMGAVVGHIVSRLVGVGTADEVVFIPLQALRAWVWALFLLAVAGETVRRLSRQTQIAEEALAVSLEQQELMLVNEERSRRQISAVLHDRVQAGLMTACLELRLAARESGSVSSEQIEQVVQRIEDIRGSDVRQAARDLSPDLAHVDVRTALTELARVYEPGMTTAINVDLTSVGGQSQVDTDVLLACFRVAEQGLLNAAGHGRATECELSIVGDGPDRITLTLHDDGHSVQPTAMRPGFGTAVLEAWCRVLGGTWSLEFTQSAGAVLRAEFPVRVNDGAGTGPSLSHM